MNLNEALFLIIRSVFFLLTFLAAATEWHHDGKKRLTLMLMFASAGFVIVVYTAPAEGLPNWVSTLATMALVAHPPLILHLLAILRPISLMIQRASLAGMFVVWLLLLITSVAWHRPVVVSYVLAFESLALLASIEGRTCGAFLRWRFLFIAGGIDLWLLLLFLLATGKVIAEPAGEALLALLSLVLVIFTGFSYLFGFAPPSWLEELWQFMQLQGALQKQDVQEVSEEEGKGAEGLRQAEPTLEQPPSIARTFSDEQELLFLLIESSLDGIFAFDHDCRYTIWNPAMVRLSGVSHEQAIGQYAFELFPFLEETGEDRFFYRALAGQNVLAEDRPFRVANTGREVFFMGSYAPLRNQGGQIVGGVGVIHEITKRKQAEEEIRRQATRANALLRAAARLNAPLNLSAVVQAICEEAAYALQVPIATVSLYDNQEKVFIPAGEVGLPSDAHELLPPTSSHQREKLVVIPDVQALTQLPYARSYLALNIRTIVTVIIENKGQLLGRLNIATVSTLHLFTQDELALLRGLADQAALAMNNAHLFEEIKKELLERAQAEKALHQHVARSRALNDISQALAQASLDTQSVLQTVVERVATLIGDGGVISLISPDKQWLDPVALHHQQPKAIALMKNLVSASRLRVGEGIIGKVAQNGQALLIPAIPQHELKTILKPEHRLYAEQVGLHSAIYVPLRISGRIIGTLGITRDKPDHPYSQEDQLFLQEVADRAALAIANAELFETVQHQLSERRRAEEERKRFFNISKDMFTVVSTDGFFKQLNPAWESTLGFSLSQLFKEPFFGLIHPDDRPLAQAEFQKLTEESNTSFEIRLQCANESYCWTAWNMTAFKTEGVIYAVGRDITEGKEVEVILRKARDELEQRVKERTAELKQANKEIRRFAYIVSHDLRAPLVNLKGFAGELRFGLAEIEPILTSLLPQLDVGEQQIMKMVLQEEIPEAMDFIDSSVTRMNNLINALLKLSRLGHREFIFEQIDMDELLDTTLDTLAHQIEQRQVTVNVKKLPHLVADRVSMEQIVSNLLTNAVLYLEPTRRGMINVIGIRDQSESIYHIQDNGRGIAANDLDKLFEPFRRIGKPDVPGEGMGLAYVQTLVRRHGGRIWCQSEPGVGTTFSFSISHQLTEGTTND